MKKWQSTVLEHHSTAIILNDTHVKIPNIGYSKAKKRYYDDVITKEDNSYTVKVYLHDTDIRKDTYSVNTIKEYLGY